MKYDIKRNTIWLVINIIVLGLSNNLFILPEPSTLNIYLLFKLLTQENVYNNVLEIIETGII